MPAPVPRPVKKIPSPLVPDAIVNLLTALPLLVAPNITLPEKVEEVPLTSIPVPVVWNFCTLS